MATAATQTGVQQQPPLDPNAPAAVDPNALLKPQDATAPAAPAPTGLIASNMTTPAPASPATTPGATPPGSTASGYSPTLQGVDSKQTVAGQVNSVLSGDNPLIQTARNQAAEAANARGLQNSSMAVQAGEQAAINAALPIAQQDAQTYNRVASENAQASNQLQLQGLRGDQAVQVSNIEANYKTLMQTSASATQLYTEIVKSIGALLDDPNTTAEQKQQAIDKQIQLLQSGLSAIGSTGNVNLAGLLDFSQLNQPVVPAPAAPQTLPTPPAQPVPSTSGYAPGFEPGQ